MRILIEEEYGYKYWAWTPREKTSEGLLEYMATLDRDFFDESVFFRLSNLLGVWEELILPATASKEEEDRYYTEVLNPEKYDGSGHFHMFENSHLTINGKQHAISELGDTSRV
jgi:hypothetical protein